MNQSTCFGSPAVKPACPKIRVGQSGIGPSGTHLQASSKTRVTARPPTRANQPRHHGTTAYTPNLGRDIGLRCYRFHVVPLLFVGTDSRKPNISMRTPASLPSFLVQHGLICLCSPFCPSQLAPVPPTVSSSTAFHRTVPHCSA